MAIVNSGTTDNISEIISGTTVANISNDNSEIGADIHATRSLCNNIFSQTSHFQKPIFHKLSNVDNCWTFALICLI
jgi:hypothetical protein